MRRILLSSIYFSLLAFACFSTNVRAVPADDQPSAGAIGQEQFRVGLQPDGRVVVPTNQILDPVGKQVLFPGRPVDLALLDQDTLVVKNMKDLLLVDIATGAIKQTLTSPVGFSATGLLVKGQRIFVTDVKDHVRVAVRNQSGTLSWEKPLELPKPSVGGSAYPTGIARLSDEAIWVLSSRGNSACLMETTSSKMLQEVPVGVAPYAICCPRSDLCYVTNWGGDRPKTGQAQASSSGTPTQVDQRGVANRGTVSVLQVVDGKWKQVKTIAVGLHPAGMALSRDGSRVYVANAHSDTVSFIDTNIDQVVETISCRP